MSNNQRNIECIRCHESMNYIGKFKLEHDETEEELNLEDMNGLGLNIITKMVRAIIPEQKLSIYACPRCSKIEFFAFNLGWDNMNYETDCLECGTKIDANKSSCPSCGWSWHNEQD